MGLPPRDAARGQLGRGGRHGRGKVQRELSDSLPVLDSSGDNANVPAAQAIVCDKGSLPPLQGNANVEDEQ